jgi:hypothetical protein
MNDGTIIKFPNLPDGVTLATLDRLIATGLLRPEHRHDRTAIQIAMNEMLMRIMLASAPEGATRAGVVEQTLEALWPGGDEDDPSAA